MSFIADRVQMEGLTFDDVAPYSCLLKCVAARGKPRI